MDDKYDTRWTIHVAGENYFDKYLMCLRKYIICMHMILFEYKSRAYNYQNIKGMF